ncbi:MAG: hypothetical protein HY026_04715 [Deltaproteobacteria bacterium]|nr:hypothetical protein [Deltaproteobacteria bacterium]
MDNTLNQHSKILTEWADMGRKFNQPMAIPAWHSIEPFIKSCQKFLEHFKKDLEHLKKETETLLEESSKILSPFQDPFCIDLSSNRWFAGCREENYSDWLAWIIEQLKEPRLIFRLLDIDDEIMLKECEGIKPDVKREECVKEGHEGQEGRLDITIRYPSKLLIHVEVKTNSAEEADLGKNVGYKKSLEERYGGTQYHRLLVTEAEETSYDDYKVLKWTDICIKLRKMVLEKQIEQPLAASLILSFTGAVEQNLLELPHIHAENFDSRTFDYIKKILEGGCNYDKN